MFFSNFKAYLLLSLFLVFPLWSGFAYSCPTDDYGNSFDTATKVKPNSTIKGVVNCDTDYDFFGVELTKAGTLNISIANPSAYAWFYRTKDYSNSQRFNYPGSSFDLPIGIYHFVVSGHTGKPYTITLSCNDCTGVVIPTKVTSVTPSEVTFKKKTTFTIQGTKLPDTLAAHIHDCRDPSGHSTLQVKHLSNTKQTFECIPDYTTGQKQYIIKDKSGGKTLKTGFITVKESANIPPNAPQITIPSSAKIGDKITVSIKLGTDQDGDQVKAWCHANSSNYSIEDKNNKNPYASNFVTGGSTVKITDLVFKSSGNKSILCKTVDKRNVASGSVSKGIKITPKESVKQTLNVSTPSNGKIFTYEYGNPIKPISGIDCGSDCSESYTKGVTMKLAVEPKSGYKFIRWGGDCASNANGLCSLTMDTNKTVSATFEKKTIVLENFTLGVSIHGHGTVTSSPSGINCSVSNCSEDYKKGTTIKLTANPKDGYIFDGWSGECTGLTCEIINIDSNKFVAATFKSVDGVDKTIDALVLISKNIPTTKNKFIDDVLKEAIDIFHENVINNNELKFNAIYNFDGDIIEKTATTIDTDSNKKVNATGLLNVLSNNEIVRQHHDQSDLVVYITDKAIFSPDGKKTGGIAFYSEKYIHLSRKNYVVISIDGENTIDTNSIRIIHEIGHILGLNHDSTTTLEKPFSLSDFNIDTSNIDPLKAHGVCNSHWYAGMGFGSLKFKNQGSIMTDPDKCGGKNKTIWTKKFSSGAVNLIRFTAPILANKFEK